MVDKVDVFALLESGDLDGLKDAISADESLLEGLRDDKNLMQQASWNDQLEFVEYLHQSYPERFSLKESVPFAIDRNPHGRVASYMVAQDGEPIYGQRSLDESHNVSFAHFFATIGNLEDLQTVIKKYPPSLKSEDSLGRLPAHYAALNGHLEILELLQKEDVYSNVLSVRDDFGHTPLDLAAWMGKTEITDKYQAVFEKDKVRIEGIFKLKEAIQNQDMNQVFALEKIHAGYAMKGYVHRDLKLSTQEGRDVFAAFADMESEKLDAFLERDQEKAGRLMDESTEFYNDLDDANKEKFLNFIKEGGLEHVEGNENGFWFSLVSWMGMDDTAYSEIESAFDRYLGSDEVVTPPPVNDSTVTDTSEFVNPLDTSRATPSDTISVAPAPSQSGTANIFDIIKDGTFEEMKAALAADQSLWDAYPQQYNESGMDISNYAAKYGTVEKYKYIISERPDLVTSLESSLSLNDAHFAAGVGSTDILEYIKENHPQLLSQKDDDGELPLDRAKRLGQQDAVDLLSAESPSGTGASLPKGNNLTQSSDLQAKEKQISDLVSQLKDSGHLSESNGKLVLSQDADLDKITALVKAVNEGIKAKGDYYQEQGVFDANGSRTDAYKSYAKIAKDHPDAHSIEQTISDITRDGKAGDQGWMQAYFDERNKDAALNAKKEMFQQNNASIEKGGGVERGGMLQSQLAAVSQAAEK